MSRGRENIATCLDVGSIETTMSVSVLWPPSCSSAPMSRMFSRSLPSHGGRVTLGTGVPVGPGEGEGICVRALARLRRRLVGGRRLRRRRGRWALAVGFAALAEDAVDELRRGEVVPGHDRVPAGHDQEHGQQTSGRDGVHQEPRPSQPAAARALVRVEECRDLVRVDGGHDPVDEEDHVENEDRREHPGLKDEPDELEPVHPKEDPADERGQEQRRCGKADGAPVRPGVGMAEPGKEEGEEGCRER